MINTTGLPGRLGNQLFRNIVVSFIAKKFDLNVYYDPNYYTIIQQLGIDLYSGKKNSTQLFFLNNDNIAYMLTDAESDIDVDFVITHNFSYFQIPEVCFYMKAHLDWSKIYNANKYKDRFNSNNDLYVHVRLDDVTGANPGLEYYDKTIGNITFAQGYISSDSPDHPIVKTLMDKYNLRYYDADTLDTLWFASSCKNIVLSNGTYSWFMGFFSQNANVYWPEIKEKWHGDIFVFPEWHEVKFSNFLPT